MSLPRAKKRDGIIIAKIKASMHGSNGSSNFYCAWTRKWEASKRVWLNASVRMQKICYELYIFFYIIIVYKTKSSERYIGLYRQDSDGSRGQGAGSCSSCPLPSNVHTSIISSSAHEDNILTRKENSEWLASCYLAMRKTMQWAGVRRRSRCPLAHYYKRNHDV